MKDREEKRIESEAQQESIKASEAESQQESIKASEAESQRESQEESERLAAKINCKVGDIITFGSYEQDNDLSNGKESIEWLVLDKQGSKALVISKYALDARPYNTEDVDVTWETCDLRKWLNGEFYNGSFSEAERKQIEETVVKAKDNKDWRTDAGNDTRDKVFLLSIFEAENFFEDDYARIYYPTEYAVAQGAYRGQNEACAWWLRSPGGNSSRAAFVPNVGAVFSFGDIVYYVVISVRPALWINLAS